MKICIYGAGAIGTTSSARRERLLNPLPLESARAGDFGAWVL